METLKKVLMVNAISSGATGILMVILPGFISNLFGTTVNWPYIAVGAFLIVFATFVGITARKPQTSMVRLIIAGDVSWVIGSALIITEGLFGLTTIGYVATGAVAAWVAMMAILQYKFLRVALQEASH